MREHGESIAESRTIVQSTRHAVLERDNNRCQRCGIEVTPRDEDGAEFQLHHLIPFAAGGPNKPENLVTLCNDCHLQAHQLMKTLPEKHPELLSSLRTIICDTD
ncbi:HNH endonuclease [Halovenus halobia]|uniref:HNH endonuclease n=1 Tax=Halovenus halobia TaxID=3396622 RepID=UPI003F5499B0